MFLDLSVTKLVVLGVIALVVFGPERLPKVAAQAGRMLRELRRMAEGAKAELQGSLGPEFENFDLNDLNPKSFMRKHLLDDMNGHGTGMNGTGETTGGAAAGPDYGSSRMAATVSLQPGESPPYDAEAT